MKSPKFIRSSPTLIGFDAKRYYNNSTGLGNYARWLIDGLRALPQEKLDFILFTPSSNGSKLSNNVVNPSGIWQYAKWLWRVKGINKSLIKNNIAIYHGLSNEIPFGIHRTGIKTVVTIHDLINLRYPENYGVFDRWVYKKKLNYAQKYADLIVTPSEQTKQDLFHYFKTDANKIEVIPLSIPQVPEFFKPTESNYLLCISSFNKRKNLENLIKAYSNLKDKRYPLVIAGKMGEEYDSLTKLVKSESSIKLITNPSTEQIHRLYHNALFCIYPSVFEGFGIPILEAFAHKKVVATSNTSSMPEVGGEAAYYFNPLNINEITQSIKLLIDPKIRTELEEKIPNQLAKFHSETLIEKYRSNYFKLINL